MGRVVAQHITILAGCLLHFALPAHAQICGSADPDAPAAALHWVRLAGAEDCIRGETLARDVERRLKRTVFAAPRDATVLIEGYAARSEGVYRANLRMSTSPTTVLGERELVSKAADCRELSETIIVVLAIMIDPDAASSGGSAELTPSPAPSVKAASGAQPEDGPHRLMSFVRGAYNLLPAQLPVALGVGAAYEFESRRWGALRVEGVGFFPQKSTLELPALSAGAFFELTYGGLAYCPLSASGSRGHISSCLGGELGVMRSEGFGLDRDKPGRTIWVSASAALRGSLRLVGALRAYVGLSLLVTAPTRYEVTVVGRDPLLLHNQEWLGGTLDLGIGANFSL